MSEKSLKRRDRKAKKKLQQERRQHRNKMHRIAKAQVGQFRLFVESETGNQIVCRVVGWERDAEDRLQLKVEKTDMPVEEFKRRVEEQQEARKARQRVQV